MNRQEDIQVYADWTAWQSPVLMGMLRATLIKGREVFAFEYEPSWLAKHQHIHLDPDLRLYTGSQFLNDSKPNFGIFLDSSPDRWGRLLMRRREAFFARKEDRKANTLVESDYLLGVYDEHRMGAIRFKVSGKEAFQHDNQAMAAPPFASLRALEQASLKLEQTDSSDDPDYIQWLNLLIAPGSSLGGARPKASVKDPKGCLWIAKFPSIQDDKDTASWEMLTYRLAIESGIVISESMLQQFSSKHRTFLTKRFDRTPVHRIHFASAMTMLGLTDGKDHLDGISYLHIAEWIMQNGASVNEDLEQLWRRIVFNICVSNTDDHLRNHGFLLTPQGWRLSPAYDLNPVEMGVGLKLNINEYENMLDLDLALEVAPFFRVNAVESRQILTQIKTAVSQWRLVAHSLQISRSEQEQMESAFIATL